MTSFGISFSTTPPADLAAPYIIIPACSADKSSMSVGPTVILCNHTYILNGSLYEGSMTLADYALMLKATGGVAQASEVGAALEKFWHENGTGDTYALFSGEASPTLEQAVPDMDVLLGALQDWNMSEMEGPTA